MVLFVKIPSYIGILLSSMDEGSRSIVILFPSISECFIILITCFSFEEVSTFLFELFCFIKCLLHLFLLG